MHDLASLAARLSDLLDPSAELESEVAAIHLSHAEGVCLGRNRMPYLTSLDAAFAFAEAVVPHWFVEHFGDDATGTVGAMSRGGATCELTDGRHEVQGQSFNRPTSVVVAALKALAKAGSTRRLAA